MRRDGWSGFSLVLMEDDSSQPSFADPRFRATGLLRIFTPTALHFWDFRLCFLLFSALLAQLGRMESLIPAHSMGCLGMSVTRGTVGVQED